MTQPATRLITLIMLLQRQPNQKGSDLAEKLGVSIRTLHRYIAMLDEMGIPIYSERGPHGGFSLVRGYKMPPLIFTPEEATAVYLGTSLVEEIWGRLYYDAAQGALAKLDNVLPDDQRDEIAWARRSLVAAGLYRSNLSALIPLLETLRQAVRDLRRVHITYLSGGRSGKTERDLDPYAMVYRGGWWYVVGFCHLRQAVRSFRVDRITSLTLGEASFQVPEEFDIRGYLAQEFEDQPKFHALLLFAPHAAQVALANRSYWQETDEQPDGSVIVTLSAPDLEWAASTILAFGPLVTVLEPPELRRVVRDWTQEIIRFYENDPE